MLYTSVRNGQVKANKAGILWLCFITCVHCVPLLLSSINWYWQKLSS